MEAWHLFGLEWQLVCGQLDRRQGSRDETKLPRGHSVNCEFRCGPHAQPYDVRAARFFGGNGAEYFFHISLYLVWQSWLLVT